MNSQSACQLVGKTTLNYSAAVKNRTSHHRRREFFPIKEDCYSSKLVSRDVPGEVAESGSAPFVKLYMNHRCICGGITAREGPGQVFSCEANIFVNKSPLSTSIHRRTGKRVKSQLLQAHKTFSLLEYQLHRLADQTFYPLGI